MTSAALASADTRSAAALELGGETLWLRADRSVVWPAAATLFVADTHFGKGEVFRRAGVSLPRGTTDADLARLTRALAEATARRLVVLGDFMHAPPRPAAPWLAQFERWRAAHADVEIVVVRGNHDRGQRPDRLGLHWKQTGYFAAPFVCRHEPGVDRRGPMLAGHLHPAVTLVDGSERLRLPVFWAGPAGLVLPAFSGFAGSARVAPSVDDRVFAIAGDCVLEVGASD